MNICRALLLSFALTVGLAVVGSDEIRLLPERTVPMPWFHRNGDGLVLELGDSSDIISRDSSTAEIGVLMTARKAPPREIDCELKLMVPDSGRVLTVWREKGIRLRTDVTVSRVCRISLGAKTLQELTAGSGGFNLSALVVKAVFTGADGKVLPALVDEGYIGVAKKTSGVALPEATVREHGGVPMLRINGHFYPGIFGYVGWNWLPARRTIKNFAASGRHLYEIVFQPWGLWRNGKLDPSRFERQMNQMVTAIVGRDPQAMIFVRWWLYVPRDWEKYYPQDLITFDDGSHHVNLLGGPWAHAAYSSKQWLEQYSAAVGEAVRRLVRGSYADRVFMVRVGYGNCGEWNNFGYHFSKFPGFSESMKQQYQAWLRRRYSSLEELNRSWGSSFSRWDMIPVPSRDERLTAELGTFRDPSASGSYRDFYRFFSEYTVSLIDHFGRIVKAESSGRLLYGVFYGYLAHHLTAPPYHSLDSGHYALERLLESKVVDTICSPYSYRNRGNNIGFGLPIDSIKAHGKLFLSELDLPTHLADRSRYHDKSQLFCTDAASSNLYYWRDYARIITAGVGGYWYDFAHDWYLYPEFRQLAERVIAANRLAAVADNSSAAEVAVILDENSVFDLSLHSDVYGKYFYDTLVHVMDQGGAPWDCYLGSDLAAVVKKKYRLIIFMNQFRRQADMIAALRNYRGSVMWVYGSGAFDGNKFERESGWTGIRVRLEDRGETGLLKGHNTSIRLGTPVVPTAYVTDPAAEKLALFPDGRCGFAMTSRPGGNLFYYSLPLLAPHVLRWVYLKSRVHLYTSARGMNVYANKSFVALWVQKAPGGEVELALPQSPVSVTDLWSGERVPVSGRTVRFPTIVGKPFLRLLYVRYPEP